MRRRPSAAFSWRSRLPQVDLGEVKAQFIRVWRRWESCSHVRGLPAAEKSLTRMFDGLNRVMYRYNFEVDWSLARFAWTVVNADICLLELAPDINYLRWLRSYFRRADRRARQVDLDQQMRQTSAVLGALADMPKSVRETSISLQDIFRREARLMQGSTAKSGYFVATVYDFLAAAALLTGAFLAAVMLAQHADVALAPWSGEQLAAAAAAMPAWPLAVWAALLALALYGYRRFARLRGVHLRQKRPGAHTQNLT